MLFALIVGKTLGIVAASLFARQLGFDLPAGVGVGDLWVLSALGGVGLTVALFVANEAFQDPTLQAQAKFAAVLSVASAGVAKGLYMLFNRRQTEKSVEESTVTGPVLQESKSGLGAKSVEDQMVDELVQMMWMQRKYAARGIKISRSESKQMAGQSMRFSTPDAVGLPRQLSRQLSSSRGKSKSLEAWSSDGSPRDQTSNSSRKPQSPANNMSMTAVVPGTVLEEP